MHECRTQEGGDATEWGYVEGKPGGVNIIL